MIIQDIVKNRFEEDTKLCPICNEKEYKLTGARQSTLLGSVIEGYNPNHTWSECECPDCGIFTKESKGFAPYKENVWFTKDSKILRGAPSCYESYIYQCIKCDGPVTRTHLSKKTGQPVSSLSFGPDENGEWKPNFITKFTCSECGHGGEVPNGQMNPKGSI